MYKTNDIACVLQSSRKSICSPFCVSKSACISHCYRFHIAESSWIAHSIMQLYYTEFRMKTNSNRVCISESNSPAFAPFAKAFVFHIARECMVF